MPEGAENSSRLLTRGERYGSPPATCVGAGPQAVNASSVMGGKRQLRMRRPGRLDLAVGSRERRAPSSPVSQESPPGATAGSARAAVGSCGAARFVAWVRTIHGATSSRLLPMTHRPPSRAIRWASSSASPPGHTARTAWPVGAEIRVRLRGEMNGWPWAAHARGRLVLVETGVLHHRRLARHVEGFDPIESELKRVVGICVGVETWCPRCLIAVRGVQSLDRTKRP